ncbi:MAG TPA: hypothetical protein VE956_04045 [Nodularia sp. (in: cyanobacteria)]|nr:hypothetical protein [Nodularia sp. (in: cyanobacteria)]
MAKNNQGAFVQNVAQSSALQPSKHSSTKKLHLPADPIGQRYITRFSHPYGAILADAPTLETTAKPEWLTLQHFLQPSQLWELHQDKEKLVGIRFGSETLYGAIDLDTDGDYHNPEAVSRIKSALESIGIVSSVPCQSSFSGGWHLILPFSEPINTFGLACAIDQALRREGFIPRPGHLEIFPNPKPYSKEQVTNYKAIRCPLQPSSGSFLLDDELQPISNNVETFLNHCDRAAARQDILLLNKSIDIARKRHKIQRDDKQSTNVNEWRADWERIIATGWTGSSQTNIIIQIIVGYGIVFLSLEGKELVDYAVNTAINAPGYREYCKHQHEIRARVQDWVECNEKNKYYSPYASNPERPLGTYSATHAFAIAGGTHLSNQNNIIPFDRRKDLNLQRSLEAQRRIQIVVRDLEYSNAFPEGATNRAKGVCAGYKRLFNKSLSQETLHKHLHLWHPKWYICDPWIENAQNPCGISDYGHSLPVESITNAQNPCGISDYGHSPYMKVFGLFLLPASAPQGQGAGSSEISENLDMGELVENSDPLLTANSIDIINNLLVFSTVFQNEIILDKYFKCMCNSGRLEKVDNQNLSIEFSGNPDITHNTPATLPQLPSPDPPSTELAALNALSADASSDYVQDFQQVARQRVQAISYAKSMVRKYCMITGKFPRGLECLRLEQIAKMQFYLDSGCPALISEANSWADANPGCLPFCLESAFAERDNR